MEFLSRRDALTLLRRKLGWDRVPVGACRCGDFDPNVFIGARVYVLRFSKVWGLCVYLRSACSMSVMKIIWV